MPRHVGKRAGQVNCAYDARPSTDWSWVLIRWLVALPGGVRGPSGTFERRVMKHGSPHIRFHDMRHTHATLELEAGIPPKVMQERLGHSSITMTLDLYSHVVPGTQKEATGRIAALIHATA